MRNEDKNDLEDYLAEVEEGLFCVPEEDRECLLRDLKAHVRELTTDPDGMRDYSGKYGISRRQLIEALGDPGETALDYMATTRHVPSPGMLALIYFLLGFFLLMAVLGARSLISAAGHPAGPSASALLAGILLTVGGVGLLLLTWWVRRDFARRHRAIPIVITFFAFASFPLSYQLMATIASLWRGMRSSSGLYSMLALFSFDFLIISLMGLYITIRHISAISAADARR